MMKRTRVTLVVLSLAALISALAFAGEFKGHPNLRRAHNQTQAAIQALQAARNGHTGDPFGGHRDNAENLLHQAQAEIEQAAAFADAHPGGAH